MENKQKTYIDELAFQSEGNNTTLKEAYRRGYNQCLNDKTSKVKIICYCILKKLKLWTNIN